MLSAAARNNAEWCDVMSRTHGALTRFDADAWSSATRTPTFYPDAVTLQPDVSVDSLLARIDASAGCSIKDSFASLDLSLLGFRVLFDAQWIVRRSGPVPPRDSDVQWQVVRDPDRLDQWADAWRDDDDPTDTFRAELLREESVTVLAGYEGNRVVAGAVLNRSETVVGVSNVFADPRATEASWSGCLAFADGLFPSWTFVGYESGDALVDAQGAGFEIAGPLRVWMK